MSYVQLTPISSANSNADDDANNKNTRIILQVDFFFVLCCFVLCACARSRLEPISQSVMASSSSSTDATAVVAETTENKALRSWVDNDARNHATPSDFNDPANAEIRAKFELITRDLHSWIDVDLIWCVCSLARPAPRAPRALASHVCVARAVARVARSFSLALAAPCRAQLFHASKKKAQCTRQCHVAKMSGESLLCARVLDCCKTRFFFSFVFAPCRVLEVR
jgi:hypothetical protein